MNEWQSGFAGLYEEMVGWRRYLHQHPELSFHEYRTAEFVAGRLREWGLDVRTGVGGTGVVGVLRGALPGPTVALRADMDALPIQDEKNCAYASTVPGVMHACGHDAHTSTLLGVAKTASRLQDKLPGTLVFVFQHAEETTPGGAAAMIEAGALDGVDVIYGVHLWTPFPVGHIYCREGPMMAAPDEFTIRLQGKGGHAGLPHQAIDSVVVGAHLVVNLQSIVSRQTDPVEPRVVSVGSFQAGSSFNVLAESCTMRGTVRTYDMALRDGIRERIENITAATCAMFGAHGRVDYRPGYPPVVNHEAEAARFIQVGTRLAGEDHTHRAPLIMAGEDFAYYLQHRPGCYMFVGAGNADAGIVHPHHHPKFDLDERAMLQAGQLLLSMALDYMA